MASKELIEKVAQEMTSTLRHHGVELHPEDIQGISQDSISTILAALQEPTQNMVRSVKHDLAWYHAKETWRAMLNASPLGEQSE